MVSSACLRLLIFPQQAILFPACDRNRWAFSLLQSPKTERPLTCSGQAQPYSQHSRALTHFFGNPPIAWYIEASVAQWWRPGFLSYPVLMCFHKLQKTGRHFDLVSQVIQMSRRGKALEPFYCNHGEDFLRELSWSVQSLLNFLLSMHSKWRILDQIESSGKEMVGLNMVYCSLSPC